ncbi:hypothetical protein DO97_16800 [Neosynechococcus sphagnicola sy1]|uniref:Uncharacterized protein n=1 Tax=Neosynechococcus sphagnicola sy1 TaxID=1497020 RepID=A0A098TP33_9CYAN|nr:hypothetical protein [Neosynechococcus sphagnicola]KGF73627.1 hypothetical protein DO97_16800 [Neosynechococcus sphagnicola sy1]
MLASGTVRLLFAPRWTAVPVAAALTLLSILPSLAQTPSSSPSPEQPAPADSGPTLVRPVGSETSILSVAGGQRLMNEAGAAVSAQNYPLAVQKLQQAREVFNQLSNFNQDLATTFSGIDNRIADSQRRKALEAAQIRDQVTYQLALVHRAQNKPELAIPLLVQVVRSQQPTRELGKKAYQQLFELGFVETPFPREGDTPAPASPPR